MLYCIFPQKQLTTLCKITTKWFWPAGLEAKTFWVIGTHDNDHNKKCWQDQVKIFLILLKLSTTKKWKFVDLKFTYKKTVWSHLLWSKWPSGWGYGLEIYWALHTWVHNPSSSFFNWFYGVMDSNLQFEFSNPIWNLVKIWYFENLSHHLLQKFRKKQN